MTGIVKGAVADVVLLLAGILISVLGNSSAVAFVAGLVLVGLGAMALGLTFFYAVGRSEDRDRERHPMG